ncbi:hypothetical protein [Pedobacter sp. NJ-S-72]
MKLTYKDWLNSIESTWDYKNEMQLLFTSLQLYAGGQTYYFFPHSKVKADKNKLILTSTSLYSLPYPAGITTEIYTTTYFKH